MIDVLVDIHLTEATLNIANDSISRLNDTTQLRIRYAQVFLKNDIDPDVLKSGACSRKKEILEAMKARHAGCVVLGTMGGFFSDGDMKKMEEYYGKFDVVIIEEAGRATLAETLVPISRAQFTGKVVLVGDHNQLPPYGIDETQIDETKEELSKYMYKKDRLDRIFSAGKIEEFKTSPFEILWEHARTLKARVHKHFLAINRRSHHVITRLVSKLFYQGKIEADPEKSDIPEDDTLRLVDYTEDEPLSERSDNYRSLYEKRVGKSYNNLREANILLGEYDRILNQHRDGSYRYGIKDITIITPFKPQRALLKEAFGVKALINRLLKGSAAEETAITESERSSLIAALEPGSYEAGAAIRTLAGSNPAGGERERLIRTIAGALIFDVSLKHGERSIMPEDLETLGLLEIETVDSIQGSENKVVMLSLVRSNTIGEIGFMGTSDGLQRLNVAFSRAQEKFIIIGDFTNTLTQARYIPKNPDPRSWFQRSRRESTGRAQIVFKETVKYYKEFRSNLGKFGAAKVVDARNPAEKGSPAKFLETVRDNLLEQALSENGFAFKDVAPLRKYHPSTVYKEARILISLGILERAGADNKTRYRFSDSIRALNAAHAGLLIDTINNIEYKIGIKQNPLQRYEIPDEKDREFVKALVLNTIDIENAKYMLDTLLPPARADKGRYYTIRYNENKLSDLGVDAVLSKSIFNAYVTLLRAKLGGAERVEVKTNNSEKQPLISVECYNNIGRTGEPLGKGHVNIKDGAFETGSLLKIINMANIAFAVSNIPLQSKQSELDQYSRLISFIQNQFMELTGKDISLEEILRDDRIIILPAIRPIPSEDLKKYYEFTIKQLEQAA